MPRFEVHKPELAMRHTGSEAFQILDRISNGVIAVIYLDGGDTKKVKTARARKQADTLALALNLADNSGFEDGGGDAAAERGTWDDYLDLLEYAGDHLVRARNIDSASDIEPLELAIGRLQQAMAAAHVGFALQCIECGCARPVEGACCDCVLSGE